MENSIREQVVPATREHIDQMKGSFREIDELEALMVNGHDAYNTAISNFYLSVNTWVGLLYGVPVVLFGHTKEDIASGVSKPWFMGTKHMDRCGLSILRRTRKYIAKIKAASTKIEATVHKDNNISLKWLKWAGFNIGQPEPFGKSDQLFHRVWL
jgi:hypothetical protein